MKIAVAGGGWYGCHIASALKAHGAEVSLFEKNETLFGEASGHNQFRLHQGLHYARSAQTRHQSRDGYHRFVERYPRLSQPVTDNIYLVPRENSLIDFETYFSIMLSSGIAVEKLGVNQLECLDASRFEGAVRCDERVVLTARAREHFAQRLNGSVQLGRSVREVQVQDRGVQVDGEHFDHLVDATWGAFNEPGQDAAAVYFEPTVLLYYRYLGGCGNHETFPALTLVDGALWSIYPTGVPGQFTLSSVTHTPLARCASKVQAYECLARVGADEVAAKRERMEREVLPYLPDFRSLFEFEGPQFSIKTKPRGMSDNRACGIRQAGPVTRVQSGKIDNIFFAADRILGSLLAH